MFLTKWVVLNLAPQFSDAVEDRVNGENIKEEDYKDTIDDKSPDEIVECESRGGKYYFWYYDELSNATSVTKEQITLTEQ
ncbi:MAG: hypothetical protein E7264_04980 [Lachnospiraceae bacterium]|nr:hypothetical protein [Lachnospiraceae bacterium]